MLLPGRARVWSLLPGKAHRRGCQRDVVCQDVVAVHPQDLLQEVQNPAQDNFTRVVAARSAGLQDISDTL